MKFGNFDTFSLMRSAQCAARKGTTHIWTNHVRYRALCTTYAHLNKSCEVHGVSSFINTYASINLIRTSISNQ